MADTYDAVFRIGDVFPADDPLARYVVRLSTALGDLRIAASPLLHSFEETPDYLRMYQVRVMAGHASEFAQLIAPEGSSELPSVQDCLLAVGHAHPPFAQVARIAHAELIQALTAPLPRAGTTLRREIGRLRQQAFHYGYKRGNDIALRKAMTAAADVEGVYRVEPGRHRARYADEIAHQLMHPHTGSDEAQRERLLELHQGVAGLLPPSARLVMHVEALWLGSRLDRMKIVQP